METSRTTRIVQMIYGTGIIAFLYLPLISVAFGIECLFADAKTRGFNIEDTHITVPDPCSLLSPSP